MRLVFSVLLILFLMIQYPLWMGRGGWFDVMQMQNDIAQQRLINEGLRARNQAMQAEVDDLLTGTEAAEERARAELGLMHEREVFVQVVPR
jgi:cell division protein FtsB